MSNKEELKPCPFCGGEAGFGFNFGRLSIICSNCDVSIRALSSSDNPKEDILKQWNTRHKDHTEWFKSEELRRNLREFYVVNV